MSNTQQPPTPPSKGLATSALVLGIIAIVFGFIPLIGIFFSIPLGLIALGLGIPAVIKKQPKGMAITGIALGAAGILIPIIVLGAFAGAVKESIEADTPKADTSSVEEDASDDADTASSDEGTRNNPYPLGAAVTDGDWTVTVNSVTLDATEAVMAENQFNDPPEEGFQYLLVNLTATYNGDDPNGETLWTSVHYVTADGNTLDQAMVVEPDAIDSLTTLYNGASVTGNIAFAVPTATAGDGTLAVTASMLGDKFFVKVQ